MINTYHIKFMRRVHVFEHPQRIPSPRPLIWAAVIALVFWGSIGIALAEPRVNMTTIAQMESSFNSKAFNRSSGAVGLCQITPVVIEEFNQFIKEENPDCMNTNCRLTPKDLFDGGRNYYVANWYMNERIPEMLAHFHIKDTVKNRLWAYNAGIGNVRRNRLPTETRNYIEKYNRLNKRG